MASAPRQGHGERRSRAELALDGQPPCIALDSSRLMASPRPMPSVAVAPRVSPARTGRRSLQLVGRDADARVADGETRHRRAASRAVARQRRCAPPRGVNFTAFDSRFTSICRSLLGVGRTPRRARLAALSASPSVQRHAPPPPAARAAPPLRAATSATRHVARCSNSTAPSRPRELQQLVDERRAGALAARMRSRSSRCSSVTGRGCPSPGAPRSRRSAFSGVRSSWLITARKSLFARFASSAWARAESASA